MKSDKKHPRKQKNRNSKIFYRGSGIGVPVAYAGRSATIIAVQKSHEDSQADEPNALGERIDSQTIGTGILDTVDIVAEFGDGTIAMWSGYPACWTSAL